MWIIKWILLLAVILLVIFFAGENAEQEVQINFWGWQSAPLLVWQVMFISFACGMIVWLGVSIIRIIQLKNEIRGLKKENTKLRDELDHLRNVTIEEDVDIDMNPPLDKNEDSLLS